MATDTFAVTLKRLRGAAGLSQPELAERAGMNRYGIAKLEQGVREPSWSTVQALAKALGVSLAAFEVEAPEPKTKPAPKRGRGRKGSGGG
jgi:transcriptional regulator with XRE-family HTH domain